MKVLSCHNYYQIRGGEDQSFEDEAALLRNHGHEVVTYTRHNDDVRGASQIAVAAQTVWSRRAAKDVRRLIEEHRPDVAHFTNTFPLISPSAHRAASRAGVAVVQSLRNYRMMCAGACLMREQRVCEDCVGKRFAWSAVRHRCYRGSLAGSLVVAASNAAHRTLGTLPRHVDVFYTLTHFARRKFIQAGFAPEQVLVKPNCVTPDPGVGPGDGRFAVFAGRLSPEKGLATLMAAWDRLSEPIPLKLLGDGPMQDEVARYAAARPHVEFLGRRSQAEFMEQVGRASLLVMPSVWYETFGRTIIEAFAKGTPVLASRLGAMQELVDEGQTGALFSAGDHVDLADRAFDLWRTPDGAMRRMREACRREYVSRYTPQINHDLLLKVYGQALRKRDERLGAAAVGALQRSSVDPI